MTPAPIDLKIVDERLEIVRVAVADLRSLSLPERAAFLSDRRNAWAADALLRRAIEALFDTARHVLAKAHGRGGLEYREVARLAAEHGIVSGGPAGEAFLRIAGFRNRLTHHYDAVTPDELFLVVRDRLSDLEQLSAQLRDAAARLSDASSAPHGGRQPDDAR